MIKNAPEEWRLVSWRLEIDRPNSLISDNVSSTTGIVAQTLGSAYQAGYNSRRMKAEDITMIRLIIRWAGLLGFVLYLIGVTVALAQNDDKEVLVIDVEGPVTPVMLSYIDRSIAEADARNAEALIIRLNTPGGSVDITREIIQTMIVADVPVVVYVWPPGGFAASAGTFITLAGHVAAMAPNTSIGAASPIDGSGAEMDETLRSKLENILVADIKSLSDRRGEEAIAWAEQTITEAKAANAEEALEIGVIDFIAQDLDDLLAQLNGFTVEVNGRDVTLSTENAQVEQVESTFLEDLLAIITNPTIALFLISIGGLAITYEIINPGGYISGIIGAILLVVGLYGVGQLPVNYAGLALIILAFILFIAELFTPTFGALTLTGVVAFIMGGIILFNTAEFAYRIPWPSIVGIPVILAFVTAIGLRKVVQVMKRQPITGVEGLLGATGTVKIALDPQGSVFVWGERWQAVSEDNRPIAVGERVKVTEVDGFRLKVQKVE
jgi:membrane-bound serine protease (ClpP class)